MGVLLDDATPENGPLMVLPGTHRGPTYDHHGTDGDSAARWIPTATGSTTRARVPLLAPAGACSFHHVRAVHGSALNRSTRSRNLLLYEFAAADAFPLLGHPRLGRFQRAPARRRAHRACRASSTVRSACRFPPAASQGSIYENQTALANRYFERPDVPAAAPRKSACPLHRKEAPC